MWLRDATRKEELPQINDLDNGEFFPYRWGQAVWAYIGGKYGDDLIGQIFRAAVRSGDPITALEQTALIDDKELSTNWHADIRAQYAPVMGATARAHTFGRSLTGERQDADGDQRVAVDQPRRPPHRLFLVARSVLDRSVSRGDATTGRIVRKLVDTALSSHFTSLQFIGSAGSWSPNSRQFVVGGVHAGKAVLAILDIADGDVAREIEVPQVGEILNPTWSPDGKSIAFSATVGGDSDLFIYDLRRRDRASASRAICMPIFSRRGRPTATRIAFVTDRFTTNADAAERGRLSAGGARRGVGPHLAGLDLRRRARTSTRSGAPDSRNLFFVSDQNGISNVYRVDLQSGAMAQVTNIDSGISGITALSPSISSAIDARTLALSAYEDGSHHIYIIDSPQQLAGTPIVSTRRAPAGGVAAAGCSANRSSRAC